MKTRTLATVLLVVMAPTTFPAPVWAQSTADDATTAIARSRFKEGVDFYDKGQFEQARVSFLQAYALKKHPAVLLNLAWSCIKSGHALEAERYFKQFLAEGKEITDKQRADANDGLTQSHSKLGRIEIAAPAGTEIMVDGEKAGTAPLSEAVSVEAGAHTVKFKGSDGATETQSVTVLGGEKASARFGRPGGSAAVVATPPSTPSTQSPSEPPPPSSPPPERSKTSTENAEPQHESRRDHPGPFSAPVTVWPIPVLAGLAVVSFGLSGLMLYFRNQAQDQANSTEHDIVKNTPTNVPPGCPPNAAAIANVMPPPSPNLVPMLRNACNAYATDNTQINQDATAGNILAGVGAAAALGAIIYWVASDKRPSHEPTSRLTVTPIVSPSVNGLSLHVLF